MKLTRILIIQNKQNTTIHTDMLIVQMQDAAPAPVLANSTCNAK